MFLPRRFFLTPVNSSTSLLIAFRSLITIISLLVIFLGTLISDKFLDSYVISNFTLLCFSIGCFLTTFLKDVILVGFLIFLLTLFTIEVILRFLSVTTLVVFLFTTLLFFVCFIQVIISNVIGFFFFHFFIQSFHCLF